MHTSGFLERKTQQRYESFVQEGAFVLETKKGDGSKSVFYTQHG
jgi:hypothetical protein